jgi:hypothetical protein
MQVRPDLHIVQPDISYLEDFNTIEAQKLGMLLDSWDSLTFALNMYCFDVATAEYQTRRTPYGRISLKGLSKVLEKFYSRHADLEEEFCGPTLDPQVWRMIALKYEAAHLVQRPGSRIVRYCVDNETACTLIRLFTKDLHDRLSTEQSIIESREENVSVKNAELESTSSQSTMATPSTSDHDVPNEEEPQAKSLLSRLPSPCRHSKARKAQRAKPKLPQLDIASINLTRCRD